MGSYRTREPGERIRVVMMMIINGVDDHVCVGDDDQ